MTNILVADTHRLTREGLHGLAEAKRGRNIAAEADLGNLVRYTAGNHLVQP
ncbi:MAG TPA: hypothetical protein VMU08_02375 [Rhizomicrobium sp.]|nr:hypothetical protein [Rhizomicrobium sp.]